MGVPKPLALIILDGFGYNENEEMNGVAAAATPNFDQLWEEYPNTLINAAEKEVGLPVGQMGNSEVGHMNLGAGRIVYQAFTRINMAVNNNELIENEALAGAVEKVKVNDSSLHLIGLLSDGGVHSHNTHLYGLLRMAKEMGLEEVYVHAILDGRDTPPKSAKQYVTELEDKMEEIGIGQIATIGGRYYYMDRDNNWERTKKAYNVMRFGEGKKASSALEAVKQSYAQEITDEFVEPTVIETEAGEPVHPAESEDAVIFFNFRADRARQLTRALNDVKLKGFDRKDGNPNLHVVCMTEYDEDIDAPVAFPPVTIENKFGEVLAQNGLKQLRTAETEKYAHVTFFFNGGDEDPNKGEDRELIASPEVATYELKPEMSVYEVKDNLLDKMEENDYDVIVLNFANPDMVGHTGEYEAVIDAIEAVDDCLGEVVDAVRDQGGAAFVTADHGNAEQMEDYKTGEPMTAHTTNPVPFIYVNETEPQAELVAKEEGKLADVAPTMLNLLQIEIPEEMTGQQLIK